MYRLAVREEDYSQHAIFHLRNRCLSPNPTVGLDMLPHWLSDGTLNPFVTDHGAICAHTNRSEVGGDLHASNLPDLPMRATEWPNVQVERRAARKPAT